MTLRRALLLLLLVVLVLGVVPAGLLLERRLEAALLERAREDLAAAPMVLKDRLASVKDVRMMHAKEFSTMPGLVQAFRDDDLDEARRMLESAANAVQERPVVVDAAGAPRVGPGALPPDLVDATRGGEMPVAVVQVDSLLHLVALAPVGTGPDWMGAVGGSTPFAAEEAAALAGLTRSGVVILDRRGGVVAATIEAALAERVARESGLPTDSVGTVLGSGGALLVAASPLDEGRVVFVREVDDVLAVLPGLRTTGLATAAAALVLSLLVGAVFAHRVARPVSELADAAEDFGAGRPEMPLRPSSIVEVGRLAASFESMRDALARRLTDLEEANEALEDRQAKLATLQAELLQRERQSSSARLLTQLAHEIRNPVAAVRNCLEVVRRRGRLEGEAAEFADMAVDELLRMHELAERMLDLHRPREHREAECDVDAVARETVQLARAGSGSAGAPVSWAGSPGLRAAIPPDDLKQVLLNLVLNALEASPADAPVEIVASRHDGRVRVEVLDRGPGVPSELTSRVFDPFFTTKDEVHGVGLGLYTAEGLVRAAGGTLSVRDRDAGPGARFVIDVPSGASP